MLPGSKDKWGQGGAEIVMWCSLKALLNQRSAQSIIRFVPCLPVQTELSHVIPFPLARKYKLTNLNHTIGTQSSWTPNSELSFSVFGSLYFPFFPSIHPSSLPSFIHPSTLFPSFHSSLFSRTRYPSSMKENTVHDCGNLYKLAYLHFLSQNTLSEYKYTSKKNRNYIIAKGLEMRMWVAETRTIFSFPFLLGHDGSN